MNTSSSICLVLIAGCASAWAAVVFAGDEPDSVTAWKSDPKRDALIWKIPLDEGGSLALSKDLVLIGGNQNPAGVGKGKGLMLAASTATGKVAWTVTHDALPERVHDMVGTISSTPAIDDDRAYYISNRGELCCVKLADGHAVWTIDMPATLGIYKRDPGDAGNSAPSPVVVGEMVYCLTGNGTADGNRAVPSPEAPSFLAVNKLTGKVVWSSNAPGKNIAYGQWSTPALTEAKDGSQILFPGGDGALYGFEPLTGKQLWKIDCRNPADAKYAQQDSITAPPLAAGNLVFVCPGLDHEMAGGYRQIVAIDPSSRKTRWKVQPRGFKGTLGAMVFDKGTVFAADSQGLVVAVDADTGTVRWTRDVQTGIPGGIWLDEGKLYIANEDGVVEILSPATGEIVDECQLECSAVGTPIVQSGSIYVIGIRAAWAIRLPHG